jgi:hypothetical protein
MVESGIENNRKYPGMRIKRSRERSYGVNDEKVLAELGEGVIDSTSLVGHGSGLLRERKERYRQLEAAVKRRKRRLGKTGNELNKEATSLPTVTTPPDQDNEADDVAVNRFMKRLGRTKVIVESVLAARDEPLA